MTQFRIQIISLLFIFLFSSKSEAKAIESGKFLFLQNCNICHINGTNVIIPEKSLRQDVLKSNGMDNLEAIRYQITNGKNGMPAFGGRLTEMEIQQISKYVLEELSITEKK